MSKTPMRLLVVDDDDVFRERLARALRARGAEVWTAGDHGEAVAAGRRQVEAGAALEGAVLDLRMPGPSGLEVLHDLRALYPELRAVILTGYASLGTAMRAGQLGAAEYLTKPAHADAIWAALQVEPAQATAPSVAPTAAPAEATCDVPTPSLASVEWLHIQQVLEDCDGNISEAARRLGMHRRSLQRKLGKYPPQA